MRTRTDPIRVLCFGDSNTYGIIAGERARRPAHERWTGVAQERLGERWEILEEGLPGRTTDLEDTVLGRPGRNGLDYFRPCVDSLLPLDVVVLMLGTNDLRTAYRRTASDVADALAGYLDHPAASAAALGMAAPRVLLATPPPMDETAEGFLRCAPRPGVYDAASAAESRRLPDAVRALAARQGVGLVDTAPLGRTGIDGCHLDAASHRAIGEAVAVAVRAATG